MFTHRIILRTSLYFIAAGLVYYLFINYNGFYTTSGPANFYQMISGEAHRPFVYRTLVPSTIKIISDNTPVSLKDRVENYFFQKQWFDKLLKISDVSFELILAILLTLGCFIAFPFLLRMLLGKVLDLPSFTLDFMPLVGIILLPTFFLYNHYIYDPATLVLFTSAFIAIFSSRWKLYYFILPLAVINKETSILLLGVFFFYAFKKMSNTKLILHLSAQFLLWFSLKFLISMHYSNNPGSFVEFHLFDHNLILYKHILPLIYFIVVVLLFSYYIFNDWNLKPKFIRFSFLLIIFCQGGLALFLGWIDELRGYYEAYPLAIILMAPTINKIFTFKQPTERGTLF